MSDRPPTWGDTLVHLLALAARLEGEGYYNLAKILRASTDATLRRAAYRLEMPPDLPNLHSALGRAAGELAALSCGPDVIDAFKRGGAALRAGRLPLFDETPNPFVCRTCGHLVLEPPTMRCPLCGAWPESFQEFMPNAWFDALEPFEAVARLRSTPQAIATLLDGLPEDDLNRQPAPGEWSMRQVLSHLHDAQGVLHARLELLLSQDRPALSAQPVHEWAWQAEAQPTSTGELFEVYRSLRGKIVARLEATPLKDWWRTGFHEEFGEVSLRQQVSYFAAHETTHLPQMAALRPDSGGAA